MFWILTSISEFVRKLSSQFITFSQSLHYVSYNVLQRQITEIIAYCDGFSVFIEYTGCLIDS